MSTHNQCGRPTYVWMCVLYRVPKRGLWQQKRRPNVTFIESCTWGYGDNSAGHMFLRIVVHTHNQCGRPTYVWMCGYYNPEPGVMATKAAVKCYLYRIPYRGLRRQQRRPNVSSDLFPNTTRVAVQHMYGCVLLCKVMKRGLWRQQRRQHVSSDLFPNTNNAADQHMYGCV